MSVDRDTNTLNKLKQGFNWSMVLGIMMVLLGIVAISCPFFATVLTELWLGWVFIFGGIFQSVYAFKTKDSGRFLLKILLGILYVATGLILLVYPLQGVLTLTLVVGSCILAQSLAQVILSWQLRPDDGWAWVLFSGIMGTIFGSLIILQFPYNAPWLIGLLVGFNLITDGTSIGMLSATARDAIEEASPQQSTATS